MTAQFNDLAADEKRLYYELESIFSLLSLLIQPAK